MKVSAPAKINLALAVAPPRPADGYHPICSWFAPLSLADDVIVERLADGVDSRHEIAWAPDVPRPTTIDWPIEKDLAVRAHRLLEREAGRTLPVRLRVEKRTPVGAGLGGGSSDGASALVAVRDVFELAITDDRLRELGASLGADVPYFLPPGAGRPALVEGLGDRLVRTGRIRSATGGPQQLLLVMPPFGCPTGAVYRAYDAAPNASFEDSAARVRAMASRSFVEDEDLFNDLAEPAMRIAPELRDVRDLVARAAGRTCHVTGSGSGLFVLLDDDHASACPSRGAGLARAIEELVEGCAARVVEIA